MAQVNLVWREKPRGGECFVADVLLHGLISTKAVVELWSADHWHASIHGTSIGECQRFPTLEEAQKACEEQLMKPGCVR